MNPCQLSTSIRKSKTFIFLCNKQLPVKQKNETLHPNITIMNEQSKLLIQKLFLLTCPLNFHAAWHMQPQLSTLITTQDKQQSHIIPKYKHVPKFRHGPYQGGKFQRWKVITHKTVLWGWWGRRNNFLRTLVYGCQTSKSSSDPKQRASSLGVQD